jgi:hypothetical protein
MTATAGLPYNECRCPDGRIKLLCHGTTSNPSGCCCATACSSSSDAKPCCGAKKATAQGSKAAKNRPCCAHAHAEPPKGPGGDSSSLVVKTTCCTKTVVAAPAADSVETTDTPVLQAIDLLALGEPAVVVPKVLADAVGTRPPPHLLTAPPDLVLVLCHFTC